MVSGTNSRKRKSGTPYHELVQLAHLYLNDVTEGPEPLAHSLHKMPFLFIGPHNHVFIEFVGSCMYPEVVTL